jgi:hypothetical protein
MSEVIWHRPIALTVIELPVPFDARRGYIVADGSSIPDKDGIIACAAVGDDSLALLGWAGTDEDPPLPPAAAEFYAALLGLRLASRSGTAVVSVDNDQVFGQMRQVKAGSHIDADALGIRDDNAFQEAEVLASNPAIRVERGAGAAAARATGAAVTVVHGSPQGVAAHSLAWAARKLRQDGYDPAADGMDWLRFLANRGGIRLQPGLRVGYDKWRVRTSRTGTVSSRVERRLRPAERPEAVSTETTFTGQANSRGESAPRA